MLEVPSLNDLIRIAENGLSQSFFGNVSTLKKSVLKVIARVFAGVAYLILLVVKKLWKNSFLTTCDVESLVSFGADFDLPNKPESFSRGKVVIKSDDNTVVIVQSTILESEKGNEYEVLANTTLTGGEDGTLVPVIAVVSGEGENLVGGEILSFRDGTPEDVDEDVVVSDGGISGGKSLNVVVNGNDENWGESVEEYRARLLKWRRNQPSGGTMADYEQWAERFSFVSKCYVLPCYPNPGAVTCVLANFQDDGHLGINDSGSVSEVAQYINDDSRRPVTAAVTVADCTEKELSFNIAIYPNNDNVKASVTVSLKMALRQYYPGDRITCDDIAATLRASSAAEKIAVSKINDSSAVYLSKPGHELAYLPSDGITWSTYNG